MKKLELVTLAMYRLGGDDKALDIEDIAMECEKISPGSFSWRKYKNQINLELVGFAVRDAKKAQNGNLLTGSHAKGWRLTAAGIIHAKTLIENNDGNSEIEVAPTKHRNLELSRNTKESQRVVGSDAFKEWKLKRLSSKSDLSKLLRINAYSSAESIEIKIARLSNLLGNDSEIDDFIRYVISTKGDLL